MPSKSKDDFHIMRLRLHYLPTFMVEIPEAANFHSMNLHGNSWQSLGNIMNSCHFWLLHFKSTTAVLVIILPQSYHSVPQRTWQESSVLPPGIDYTQFSGMSYLAINKVDVHLPATVWQSTLWAICQDTQFGTGLIIVINMCGWPPHCSKW